MNNSHIKSTLALKNISHPIDEHTKALFHFDHHAYDHTGTIRPLGVYPDTEEGLVGYWDFSKEQEIAYDLSGNDNHGTIVGATWGNGRNGKALSFDGINNYVDCGNADSLNFGSNDFSIGLWVNQLTQSASEQNLISKFEANNGFVIGIVNTNSVFFHTRGDTNARWSGISTDTWIHIFSIRKGNWKYLYVNGVLRDSKTITNVLTNSSSMNIGRRSDGRHYYNGKIHNVCVYNRALSEEEIQAHYNEGIYTIRKDGKYGGAVAVEEETVNEISSVGYVSWFANLDVGDSTDRSVGGGVFRVSRLDTYKYRVDVLQDATYPIMSFTNSLSWPAGQNNIISANIVGYYEAPGTAGRLGIGRSSSGSASLHGNGGLGVKSSNIYHATVSYTHPLAVRATNVLIKAGTYIEWESLQLEYGKSFPTSFVDGAREDGKIIYNIPLGIEWTFSEYVKNVNSMEE